MICFLKTTQCCICQEFKKNTTKCNKCTNIHVCSTCLTSMCEHNQYSKCPICRQEGWRQNNIKKNIIVPKNVVILNINENESNELNEENNEIPWYFICMLCRNICTFLFLAWMCGFITLLCLVPKLNNNGIIYGLSPLIGICEILCCTYCCFTKVCAVKINEYSNIRVV